MEKKRKKKERKLSSIFKNKSHSFVSKFNDCALKFSERKNRYCVHAYVNSYNKFKQKYNNVINKSKIMANSLLVSAVYSKTRINTNNLNRKKKKKRMKVFASFKTLITSRKNFTYVYTNVFYYTYLPKKLCFFVWRQQILSLGISKRICKYQDELCTMIQNYTLVMKTSANYIWD